MAKRKKLPKVKTVLKTVAWKAVKSSMWKGK